VSAGTEDDDLDALLNELGAASDDVPEAPEEEGRASEAGSDGDDLDALLAELGAGDEDQDENSARESLATEEQTDSGDPDLDSLLAELGMDEEPQGETGDEAAQAGGDPDLDSLLAELGDMDENPGEPGASAGEESTAAQGIETADPDLDELLAELGATDDESADPSVASGGEASIEADDSLFVAQDVDETVSPANESSPRSAAARPADPARAFDAEEESKPQGTGWNRFSRSGYTKAKESTGRSKPWRRSSESSGDETEGGPGWNKLRDEGGDDDTPPRPTAGWDKLRRP
jgi:hypothetical protein